MREPQPQRMVPRNPRESQRPLFRGELNAKRAAKIRQDRRRQLACSCAALHAGAKIIEVGRDKPVTTPGSGANLTSIPSSERLDHGAVMTAEAGPRALSRAQVDQFIQDGFVRIDRAFSRQWAEEGRTIMWRDTPCDPNDKATWTRPVIRLPGYGGEPFRKAANTPILHAAFDQLVGKGRWMPRQDLGTFPVRFPHPDDPGDAGWHVDVSFPGDDCDPNEKHDFSSWRVNVTSRDRALLMLFLFSDVSEDDAPTRIRVGSHFDMARYLAPAANPTQ